MRYMLFLILTILPACLPPPECKDGSVKPGALHTGDCQTTTETGAASDDTAADSTDTTDTTLETGDTTDSTETSTDTSPDCAFEVAMAGGGTVIMSNELTVTLSSDSPSGDVDPTEIDALEVLRLDYTAVHDECPALVVTEPLLVGRWTDMASSGWSPTNIRGTHLDSGDDMGEAVVENQDGLLYVFFNFGFIIEGGNTSSLAFYADVSAGSMELDDAIRFDAPEDSVDVSEDGVTIYTVHNPPVTGGTQVL